MQNIADKVVNQKAVRRGWRLAAPVLLIVMMMAALSASAQTSRASVSVAEVTGTFRHVFAGKFKGSSSDIMIASAGKGKLHIAMELLYPYVVKGDLMVSVASPK